MSWVFDPITGSLLKVPTEASGSPTKWYSGATDPDNSIGNNGDFYLNTSNGNVFVKVSGAWA